jgi:hypothetical protein
MMSVAGRFTITSAKNYNRQKKKKQKTKKPPVRQKQRTGGYL